MSTETTIKLKIDNVEVAVPEGTTILDAAKSVGIIIPTLCNLEGLTGYGGCRLCMVEIHGSPKLFAACVTPVGMGMEVITQSDKLREYRKMTVQLLLSERTHICSVCVANNACELQKLANDLGVDHVMFEREWTNQPVDSTHDFLVFDRNRCILCTRCIRVCKEIEGVHTLDLKLRGKDAQVIIDLDDEWGNSSSCTSCRKCAKVCPVGAIYVESVALEETKDKSIAEFVLSRRNR
ncbi:MAG: 2Fe-2S iron-sulfur cluster-binding protein [Candidatus Bathyarchaeota archaeon]|nr:2Fe-2S iron-sulfur cluster-binding protein [Candidatus Bathyarchaeota archaeon]